MRSAQSSADWRGIRLVVHIHVKHLFQLSWKRKHDASLPPMRQPKPCVQSASGHKMSDRSGKRKLKRVLPNGCVLTSENCRNWNIYILKPAIRDQQKESYMFVINFFFRMDHNFFITNCLSVGLVVKMKSFFFNTVKQSCHIDEKLDFFLYKNGIFIQQTGANKQTSYSEPTKSW